MQGELVACWATGRSYDTRAKYYLLPGNRCCPGLSVLSCLTSLPTCPGPPQRQLFATPHAATARSAAWFSGPGGAQLTGAWRMLAVGRLRPGTRAFGNQLVLHKLSVQMSGDNNFSAPVNLQPPCLCPHRCIRRQQRDSRGRAKEKIILHPSVFVDWPIHLWKMS